MWLNFVLSQTGSAVASLKHHSAPITTVEWQPCESSVLAAGGEDDQISLWDLAVERDDTDTDTEIKVSRVILCSQCLQLHRISISICIFHDCVLNCACHIQINTNWSLERIFEEITDLPRWERAPSGIRNSIFFLCLQCKVLSFLCYFGEPTKIII